MAATRRYFFDLLSDEEVDVLTAVFDRVLTNLDRVTDDSSSATSPPARHKEHPR